MSVDINRLKLRKATEDDLMLYFDWVNDPAVRANSFNTNVVLIKNHREWFTSKIKDVNTVFYILEYEHIPAGQIRFDQSIDGAKINFSIDKQFRGRGLGKHILQMASQRLISEFPNLSSIYGYVKKNNTSSIKAFQSAGFIFSKEEMMQGIESVLFVYPRELK